MLTQRVIEYALKHPEMPKELHDLIAQQVEDDLGTVYLDDDGNEFDPGLEWEKLQAGEDGPTTDIHGDEIGQWSDDI